MRIVSIDPGVMTGYCYAAIQEKHLYFYPFQATDDVDDLWRRLHKFRPEHIICENFEFRGGARKGLNLFPIQLIGIVRLYESIGPTPLAVHLQSAGQGKAYYTDPILKSMSLYRRGVPHGVDASRHLLQWATFGYGYQFFEGEREFATIVDMEAFRL